MSRETSVGGDRVRFGETLWSNVLKARDRAAAGGADAFERLARAYWKPVYFFIRRRGRAVEDAKDLAQGFFAFLLERDALAGVDPRRGRFRTFLLTLLARFLANERDRARAQKRGGDRVAIDVKAAERDLASGPSDAPEAAFERAWGADLLARAFEGMRGEKHFDALELALTHGLGPTEIAGHLGIKAKDAENALARARKRFRAMVLEEILLDVETPEDAEEELRRLLERIR